MDTFHRVSRRPVCICRLWMRSWADASLRLPLPPISDKDETKRILDRIEPFVTQLETSNEQSS